MHTYMCVCRHALEGYPLVFSQRDCVVHLVKAPTLWSFDRGSDPYQCGALAVRPEPSVSNSLVSLNAAGGP